MRKQLLPLGLILLLAGLLTLFLQEYMRQFVRVLLYVFWIGRLLVESLPQVVTWGLFIAGAILFVGGKLLRQTSFSPRVRRAKPAAPGRIEAWANLVEQAEQETYYKWQLAQPLHELMLAAVGRARVDLRRG